MAYNSLCSFCFVFYGLEQCFLFSESFGKKTKNDSNKYFEGFTTDLPISITIWIETLSHPHALLGFKYLIIRSISSSFISVSLVYFSVS